MAEFEPALKLVLYNEGGFVDNPSDDGKATNLGISLRFYRSKVKADATVDDIKNLTVNDAAAIYRKFFWDKYPYALIQNQQLANRVFDLHVNTGQGVSLLQKAVNHCIGSHLVIDDQLGLKTLQAVNSIPVENLYDALITQAQHYYADIVANHPQDKIFLNGWINRLSSQPA